MKLKTLLLWLLGIAVVGVLVCSIYRGNNNLNPIVANERTPISTGTASQTPWGSNIDGANYSLSGVSTTTTKVLTGARIIRRVVSLPDTSTLTMSATSTDVAIVTALSQGALIATTTGGPTSGQLLTLRIKSASSQTLTWASQYRGGTLTLPTATTGGNKTDYLGFIWNAEDSKWDFIASSPNY